MTSIEGLCFLRIILMSLHDVNLQALLSVTSQCCRRTVVGSPRIDPPRPDAPGSDLGNRGRDVTANPRRRPRAPPLRPRARRKEVTVRGQERTRFGGHEGSGSPGGRRLPSGALAEPHRSNAQTFGTLPGRGDPADVHSKSSRPFQGGGGRRGCSRFPDLPAILGGKGRVKCQIDENCIGARTATRGSSRANRATAAPSSFINRTRPRAAGFPLLIW